MSKNIYLVVYYRVSVFLKLEIGFDVKQKKKEIKEIITISLKIGLEITKSKTVILKTILEYVVSKTIFLKIVLEF